jgi:hypothetical protein
MEDWVWVSPEDQFSAGFDGFRFWVLSSVGFSSNDHRKSDLRWSIPPPALHLSGLTLPLQLSLSLFFSSLGSLGLRKEEQNRRRRKKNRKEEERRERRKNNKGKKDQVSSLFGSPLCLPHFLALPSPHDHLLLRDSDGKGKRKSKRKKREKRRKKEEQIEKEKESQ